MLQQWIKKDGTITLTKENIISNDVDTSKAGTYHVTYKVTDKNGASIEKDDYCNCETKIQVTLTLFQPFLQMILH